MGIFLLRFTLCTDNVKTKRDIYSVPDLVQVLLRLKYTVRDMIRDRLCVVHGWVENGTRYIVQELVRVLPRVKYPVFDLIRVNCTLRAVNLERNMVLRVRGCTAVCAQNMHVSVQSFH